MKEWNNDREGWARDDEQRRIFDSRQEPGFGRDPHLLPLHEYPKSEFIFNGGSALANIFGTAAALQAPGWAKLGAAIPASYAVPATQSALGAYLQLQGRHPTQRYIQDWERQIAEAMQNGSTPFDFAARK